MLPAWVIGAAFLGAVVLLAHFDKAGRAVWLAVAIVLFITAVFVCGLLLAAGAISFQ